MKNTYKVTVLGDIMCEPALLKQVTNENGFDFAPVFSPLKGLITEADYVIANLETPLAGKDAGYTDSLVSFNTPDELAHTLADIGVDCVSTANNHCFDRSLAGNARTLRVLDEVGIAHTGSYASDKEKDRIHYFTLGGAKIAVIAYTYTTNEYIRGEDGRIIDTCVNLLRPGEGVKGYKPHPKILEDTKAYIAKIFGRKLTWEEDIGLRRVLGIPVGYGDNVLEPEKYAPYLEKLKADMEEARRNADLILYLPHVGGQFNTEPGTFSSYMIFRGAEYGADAVFAAHSHTTQCADYVLGKPCFYSLGNVSMWPHSTYSVVETLPEYGLAAHIYISEKKIVKTTFSVFKMVQDDDTPLHIVPTDELYVSLTDEVQKETLADEVASIVRRVTKRDTDGIIRREYEI